MWIGLIDTAITFSSHIIAAVSMEPLKYSKRKTFLIWGIWLAAALISSCFQSMPKNGGPVYAVTAFTCTCLLHVILYFFTTTGNHGERFFLILSYAAFFTASCAVTQYINTFFLPVTDWMYLVVYGSVLAFMLWIFLKKLLPIFRQSARSIGKSYRILSILMALFMLGLMSWFVYPSKLSDFTLKQASGLIILLIIMFVTYAVIFVCIRNIAAAASARQMKTRLELLTTQVQTQKQASYEARRSRHDARHHNLAILQLAEQGNSAEIVKYIQALTEAEPAPETIWCENDTLNSILSVYTAKANDAHIKVDILAQAEQDLPVSPSDLVTITANLFENAIHGASASAISEPTIYIRIHHKSNKLVIRIENSCKKKLNYPDGFPHDKYDVGLLSIEQAIDACDGELSLLAHNGIFSALVLLNLTYQSQSMQSVPQK